MIKLIESSFSVQRQPLLKVDEVPPRFREPAIISGYRPFQCTPFQSLASVFNATNETLNFWTHFIPTWYFIWRLLTLRETLDFCNDTYTASFLAYMLTCCTYPLISCSAHAFSNMSGVARDICYFLDYGALSLYSFGAGMMYRSYVLPKRFMSQPFLDLFAYGCVVFPILSTLSACCSRFSTTPSVVKILRLGAFVLPFSWMSTPLAYRLIFCDEIDECASSSLPYHASQFASAFFAAFVYALHVPERLYPGKFDIVGHSHQLLHIGGIMATHFQMHAALLDLEERRTMLTAGGWVPSPSWVINSAVLVALADAIIIVAFSLKVLKKHKWS